MADVDSNPSDCWEWNASRDTDGYGVKVICGKRYRASRLAYAWSNWDGTGDWKGAIPQGMMVLHECDNPPCCNPDHLFLGTQTDNMRDMVNKGRRPSTVGENHPRAKLTDEQAREIRGVPRTYGSEARLAAQYGVSRYCISKIRRNKTWKYV
jgi:hypothetical protein